MSTLVVGCSGDVDRVPTNGRVLIDGQPLAHGTIQVTPVGARPAYGTIVNGEYVLDTYGKGDGTLPGSHPVTITATEAVDGDRIKWHAPKKYATPGAGLVVEIAPDGTAKDIELSWQGGKPFIVSSKVD